MRVCFLIILFCYSLADSLPTEEVQSGHQTTSEGGIEQLAEGVYPLTIDSFKAALASFQVVLVLFHDADCNKCDIWAPEFADLAVHLAEIEYVIVASINTTKEAVLTKRLGITSTPQVLAYVHWDEKNPSVYLGNPDINELMAFVKRHLIQLSSYVVKLTPDNVRNYITAKNRVWVVYCDPMNPECGRVIPELNEVARQLDGEDGGVALTHDKKWAARFFEHNDENQLGRNGVDISMVAGLPMFTFIKEPKAFTLTYDLVREIQKWQPFKTFQSVNDLANEVKARGVVVVLFIDKLGAEEAMLIKYFEIFAFQHRRIASFGLASNDTNLLKYSESGTFPSIVMLRDYDEPRIEFKGALNTEEFGSWVRLNFLPTVSDFIPQYYNAYVNRALPIFYLVMDPSNKTHEPTLMRYTIAARQMRYDGTFLSINVTQLPEVMEMLNLQAEKLPILVVEDPPNPLRTQWPENEAMVGNIAIISPDDGIITRETVFSVMAKYQNETLTYNINSTATIREKMLMP